MAGSRYAFSGVELESIDDLSERLKAIYPAK
jgi:hypothetical protein